MSELVSILLPVYNGEKFLKLSISSVLSQTYENFELLIYNDGSTDKTIEVINEFSDKRIVIFNFDKNKGIVNALNFLIDKANGNFIARIDADDVWLQNKLETQMSFLNSNSNCDFIASYAELVDVNGEKFSTNFKQYFKQNDIYKFLPNSNFIIHSTIIIKKECIYNLGLYREKYLHAEDYDLWLRLLKSKCKIVVLPEILVKYRISRYGINHKFRKKQNKNAIKLKINFWRENGFKLFYVTELVKNIYYWLFPYWIISFKRRLFNNDQS